MRLSGSCHFLVCLSALAAALPNPFALEKRQDTVADSACTNGPFTRSCWKSGWSIVTDFDAKVPPNGITRRYNLEITNTTLAPDGVGRLVMAINNQYPGPTITADWGDTLEVTVKNSLQHNGTSIHWHGVRMLNSCQHDGVNGVTECPIPPGKSHTYKFRCTQHGTSWYHSHHSAQYGDGVVGGLIINGPASANYHDDAGTLTMTDWFYDTAFALNVRAMHSVTGPPIPNTGLINGMNRSPSGGKYHVTTIKKGRKIRLRLINTGIDNNFHVSIDKHNFTVISSDFVPVKPYTTNSVAVNIGQRADIIINANKDVSNYWLRADVATQCGRNGNVGNIKSIIRYEGAPNEDPTTSNEIPKSTACYDEAVTPYVSNQVPRGEFREAVKFFSMDFNVSTANGPLVQWLINGSDMRVDWSRPTLSYIQESNYTFEQEMNVFEINEKDKWTFWVIQTVQGDPVNLPHPIHLHGHDFYVLKSGSGVWDGSETGLQFDNPVRRDTAMLPAGGHLIMGFPADNPGAWLVHCHIPWHVGQGLSWQFLERKDEILGAIGDMSGVDTTCSDWRKWWDGPPRPDRPYEMDDSGL